MFRKFLTSVVTVATLAIAPVTGFTHDKCDSLANATTAGGTIWWPVAGFQVGYYLAKYIDESTSSAANPGNKIRGQCELGEMSRAQYDAIVNSQGEDPGQQFKFLWDAAGLLAQKSMGLSQAVHLWQDAREDLQQAQYNGDQSAAQAAREAMSQAHGVGLEAFAAYKQEHANFADTALAAADMFAELPKAPIPPLTVEEVVAFSKDVVVNGAPEQEAKYFLEVGCLRPQFLAPNAILAPADRFVNDDVRPGTFIDNSMLRSPATMYQEIAETFITEVAANLDQILPPGFVNNEPMSPELPIMTSGVIGENSLGLTVGTAFNTEFMIDLMLRPEPNTPSVFIDPWWWHWIVYNPWDWLRGFRIEIELEVPRPGGPDPWDLMRIVAEFDEPEDMVMGLDRGSQFVQELYFPVGSLSQQELPNARTLQGFSGGDFKIFDPAGQQLLSGSVDGLDPAPQHVPLTTTGIVGRNSLGIEPGTIQQSTFMVDLKLRPVNPGIFIDPWWWHWIVGGNPWDWLFGFRIEIETGILRPGSSNLWDRLRMIIPFDQNVDMVMGLERGSEFVQDLYFPRGTLSKESMPGEDVLAEFMGGDFEILDPQGNSLLVGTVNQLAQEAADTDGDGVDDFSDNCAADPNADQRDTDRDGFGNECDPDFNNNGTVDAFDFSQLKSVFGLVAEDEDLNGNGVVDVFDFSKLKAKFGQAPGPSAVGMLPPN